ncbi:MAG: peptide chain release factor-like protein [Chlamydiales bacterium]
MCAIGKEKWNLLHERMDKLGIKEEDLIEKFILGGGKGGQKLNKTASCVYLKHIPSGIEIKCQKERIRSGNRYHARKELCSKIEAQLDFEQSEQQKKREKIRRQKHRRMRRHQLKVLEQKKIHSNIKERRARPKEQD